MLQIAEGEHLFHMNGKFYHAREVDGPRTPQATVKKPIICRRLKGLMAEHEITQQELAQKIGISKNSLSLRINGRRDWLYKELILVVKHFGFSEVKEVFPELYNSINKAG